MLQLHRLLPSWTTRLDFLPLRIDGAVEVEDRQELAYHTRLQAYEHEGGGKHTSPGEGRSHRLFCTRCVACFS